MGSGAGVTQTAPDSVSSFRQFVWLTSVMLCLNLGGLAQEPSENRVQKVNSCSAVCWLYNIFNNRKKNALM